MEVCTYYLPWYVCGVPHPSTTPSSIHRSYILIWSFIGLFHDLSTAWICPVAPPGMTMGSILPLLSNSFTLWRRRALSCLMQKHSQPNLWLYSHSSNHLCLIQHSNNFLLQDLFSNFELCIYILERRYKVLAYHHFLSSQSDSYCAFFMACCFQHNRLCPFICNCSTRDHFMPHRCFIHCNNAIQVVVISLLVICSGVFCIWVIRRQIDNLFWDINFSSHPSLVWKSFIWLLLAAFSSAYILAFLWLSFCNTCKFYDLCKVIRSKSISSKIISLIFLPPPSSFFAKGPWFF